MKDSDYTSLGVLAGTVCDTNTEILKFRSIECYSRCLPTDTVPGSSQETAKKKALTMMLDWDEHREGELEVLRTGRTRMSWERSGGERFVQFNLGAPPNNTARLVFAAGLQHPVS